MAIQIDPPKKLTKIDVDQAWHRLMKALNSQLTDTGWSNILFVDGTDGNDDSAKPGSITFKYQTIQAALDAALEGNVVWVGPGTYAETLTWPVDVDLLTLQGTGRGTVITSAAAATLVIAPTDNDVRSVFVSDLLINNTGGGLCLSVDGSGETSFNLGHQGIVQISSVFMASSGASSMAFSTVGEIELNDISSADDNVTFDQTGRVVCNNFNVNNVYIDNDPAGDVPAAAFNSVVFASAIVNDVAVSNVGGFAGTDAVQIHDLTGTFTDTATLWGSIIFSGRITGNVAVTFDFDDLADRIPLILDQARISGTFSFGLAVGGTGGNVAACRAIGATFYDGSADTITADSEATVDLRGAVFEQTALESLDTETTGTAGTIDRTDWFQSAAGTTGGATITWANGADPVPFTTVPDFVSVELPDITFGPVAITSKTVDDCVVTNTADGTVILRAFLQEL